MSEQYPGGFITKSPVLPDGTTASGIWNLSQQAGYQAAGTWPAVAVPDAQFNYVTMLLHGDGTNGAQNNTFLDSSTNNFTITRNGNTTQGSFSPYGSNWSTNFVPVAGLGDQLTVGNATDLQFGTGDFTFECWVNTNGHNSYQTIYDKGYNQAGAFLIQMYTDYKPYVYSNSAFLMTSSTALVVGAWTHLAVVRSGSTLTMYMNGVSVASVSNSTNFNNTSNIAVGARYLDRTYPWSGYISNLRLVKGTAVYTSAFTPPTTPLTAISGTSLLISQSNRFIDNSANNYTVAPVNVPTVQRFNPFGTSTAYETATIGGSGYFDGTNDYLSTASNAAFSVGTGNFTIECYVYVSAYSAGYYDRLLYVAALNGIDLYINDGSGSWGIGYVTGTAPTVLNTFGTSPVAGQWHYLAVSRTGTTINAYVDGARVYTGSNSANFAYDLQRYASNGGQSFSGYVTDYRFSVGTARYTSSTMTVPTAPVASDGSTTLLLSMQNGAIYDNAMMNDLETVGNAQISTSVKKYGTGSLAFDGTGDYLSIPYSPNMKMPTGDWTIEFWMYATGAQSAQSCGIYTQDNTGGYTGISISANTSSQVQLTMSYTGSAWDQLWQTIGTYTNNTWNHVAVVRSGSTIYGFFNGVLTLTITSVPSSIYSTTNAELVGNYGGSYFNGYIDDMRITKGYARYTTTFTPPTAAFPNTGPT